MNQSTKSLKLVISLLIVLLILIAAVGPVTAQDGGDVIRIYTSWAP